ncbi:hypothetical protein F5887DRAFT_1159442 [Amanita rubescens]|nr:hypothetical protein F5887DRAFT_1159442 [Amanita rubescens]
MSGVALFANCLNQTSATLPVEAVKEAWMEIDPDFAWDESTEDVELQNVDMEYLKGEFSLERDNFDFSVQKTGQFLYQQRTRSFDTLRTMIRIVILLIKRGSVKTGGLRMVCLAKTYFRNADEGLFQETFALGDEIGLITAFSLKIKSIKSLIGGYIKQFNSQAHFGVGSPSDEKHLGKEDSSEQSGMQTRYRPGQFV